MEKFQITDQGYKKFKAEIENLKNVERPNIIKQIAAARELGDLKENAEYHTAKDRQGFIEAQIADFEEKLSRVEIVDVAKIVSDKILFGATVKLEDLDSGKKITYKIVSEFEANIDDGLISSGSPVARALLGKKVNDEVEVITPGGIINYEILEVAFV
ncbi:MAG: transcription elongation factor GreA [Proteobacteria bacterium]|nr:transcription elongation factor GreA [Pseudomonadota bacterium]